MKQVFVNISIFTLVSCGVLLFQYYKQEIPVPDLSEIKSLVEVEEKKEISPSHANKNTPSVQANQNFRCDGRTYCSRMNSCAEARAC